MAAVEALQLGPRLIAGGAGRGTPALNPPARAYRDDEASRITSLNRCGAGSFRLPRPTARGHRPHERRLGDLVERPVAALGRRQAPALGGDRAALHAVGVVDGHVDGAGSSGASSGIS